MALPSFLRWSWGAPVKEMEFADYVKGGAKEECVVLKHVYVDGTNAVETEMVKRDGSSMGHAGTYFPLRTGPDDASPVKVFIAPVMHTTKDGIAVLGLPGESGPDFSRRADKVDKEPLQTVTAGKLHVHEFNSDLEKVLHSCKLATDKDIVLLQQNEGPPSTGEALGVAGVLAVLLGLIGATYLFRRKPAAPAPAPPAPVPTA
jgi:hypothetical protein